MKYDEFSKFEKAIELYLEDESDKFTQQIEAYQKKRGIMWRLFKDYSIFGKTSVKPDSKPIDETTLEELYKLIESRGIPRSEIQPYRDRAEKLFKEHGIKAMNRGWHHKYEEKPDGGN